MRTRKEPFVLAERKKTTQHVVAEGLGLLAILLFCASVLLYLRSQTLRKRFQSTAAQSGAAASETMARAIAERYPRARLVPNTDAPLRPKERGRRPTLLRELSIYDEEDPNKTFYRTVRVNSDALGNIYVHEAMSGQIRKFDSRGRYLLTIGRRGAAPGEFLNNVSWVFDQANHLYVLDGGTDRISIFTTQGRFLRCFRLARPVKVTFTGFARDDAGNFYVSFYDPDSSWVIHKYDSEGKYIGSFGVPASLDRPTTPAEYVLKASMSHGKLCLWSGLLYYSQFNPYRIDVYTPDGTLQMTIFRENSFMPPATIERVGSAARMPVPAFSSMIGVWDGKIINCVAIPWSSQCSFGAVVDIFASNGTLLSTLRLKEHVRFYSIDSRGRLYGALIEQDEPEKVVRYVLGW